MLCGRFCGRPLPAAASGHEPGIDLEPSQEIEALLRLDDIDTIMHSGVGDITVPDLTATDIDISLSGVGDIDISNLDVTTLDVLISGVGNVLIVGQVENQSVELNSLGDYEAENLVSTTADEGMYKTFYKTKFLISISAQATAYI